MPAVGRISVESWFWSAVRSESTHDLLPAYVQIPQTSDWDHKMEESKANLLTVMKKDDFWNRITETTS